MGVNGIRRGIAILLLVLLLGELRLAAWAGSGAQITYCSAAQQA